MCPASFQLLLESLFLRHAAYRNISKTKKPSILLLLLLLLPALGVARFVSHILSVFLCSFHKQKFSIGFLCLSWNALLFKAWYSLPRSNQKKRTWWHKLLTSGYHIFKMEKYPSPLKSCKLTLSLERKSLLNPECHHQL